MVEIPVRKTSRIPWWVWLVSALILVGVLFWLVADNDRDDLVAIVPATVVSTATVAPVTDLATVIAAPDLRVLVGRSVQLDSVRVDEVVGDRTFWVGPDANHRALVVLNEQPTPGQPGVEGRYDVTAGQVVDVNGTMRDVNDAAFGGQPIDALPAGQSVVIHASSLDRR